MKKNTIVLPSDPVRLEQLQRKLTEYRQRISPFMGPELQQDSVCKAAVLSTLLEHGTVTFDVLYKAIVRKTSTLEKKVFLNAWCVIRDYCDTGGAHVRGGHLPSP